MFSNLLSRVVHLRINETISAELAQKVQRSINSLRFYNASLIAITIDSNGGSLVQSKSIANSIRFLQSKHLAPIYTFAGAHVHGSANVILSIGNKVFGCMKYLLQKATYSNIGDYGICQSLTNANVDVKLLTQGEKKIRLNPLNPYSIEDISWLQDNLDQHEQSLFSEVIRLRKSQLLEKQQTVEKLQVLLEGKSISSKIALNIGLIDGIGDLNSVMSEFYKGTKVLNILPQPASNIHLEIFDRLTA